ncbi:hypothetical protein HK101_003234, partial [Irineochytrium annulatum]
MESSRSTGSSGWRCETGVSSTGDDVGLVDALFLSDADGEALGVGEVDGGGTMVEGDESADGDMPTSGPDAATAAIVKARGRKEAAEEGADWVRRLRLRVVIMGRVLRLMLFGVVGEMMEVALWMDDVRDDVGSVVAGEEHAGESEAKKPPASWASKKLSSERVE